MDIGQAASIDPSEVLERMSDAYYQVDSRWLLQYVNRHTEQFWGMEREAILGKNLWELFPHYRKIKGGQELDRAMRDRVPVRFETYSPLLHRYVEAEAHPAVRGGLSVFFRDVTERRMFEMRQLSADHMLRLAIDATGIGFWRWDIIADRMHPIYSSPNIPSEWHSQSALDSLWNVHPDDRESVYGALVRSRETGQPYKSEYRRNLSNGETVWIHAQGVVLLNNEGDAQQMIGINFDITERVNRERHERLLAEKRELENRQHELMETLDGASEGSWILDPVNRAIRLSDNWKKRLGIDCDADEKEQYAKTLEAVHPDEIGRLSQDFNGALQRRETRLASEYRIRTTDKGYVWIQARAKITYDAQGVPARLYGTGTDISERKNLELQIIEKNKLIIDFFTNISHEFKTPLSVMLMGLGIVQTRMLRADFPEKEKMQRYMQMVQQNTYRLQRLIGNLLDITKIDAGFMNVRYNNIDITDLLKEIEVSIGEFARGKGLSLSLTGCGNGLRVPVDAEKLERVILNLLSNAIKHSPDGGHIRIHLESFPEAVRVSVRDEGDGIPEEMREVVFDRFRQVNSSLTRNSEGCGIGLALSKELVELMKGKIWFENNGGRGTTFHVELPIPSDPFIVTSETAAEEALPLSKKVEMELSDIIR